MMFVRYFQGGTQSGTRQKKTKQDAELDQFFINGYGCLDAGFMTIGTHCMHIILLIITTGFFPRLFSDCEIICNRILREASEYFSMPPIDALCISTSIIVEDIASARIWRPN